MINQAEYQRLKDKYQWLKDEFGESLAEVCQFEPLFNAIDTLDQSQFTSEALDELIAYLRMVIHDFVIIKIKASENHFTNEAILKRYQVYLKKDEIIARGAKLVKALETKPSLSPRAKKYFIFGAVSIALGLLWIPALIVGGVVFGPLTAFTFSFTTGVVLASTYTIGIPVWALTLGIASVISLAGTITGLGLTKANHKPIPGMQSLMRLMKKNEAIAVLIFAALMIAGICAIPFAPFILGALAFKKSYELSKAPQGFALTVANSSPALIKKVHYGDLFETYRAKLKKANRQLKQFEKLESLELNQENYQYIIKGLAYYKKRVTFLKAEMKAYSGRRVAECYTIKPDKTGLLKNKMYLGISVNDHRGVQRVRLFDKGYDHVKHAQKVEAKRGYVV